MPLKNGEIPQLLGTEYASYRDSVIRVLSRRLRAAEKSRSHPLVLYDPMAGTAPLLPLAQRCGYTAIFNDLNSLHLYLNAAKTLSAYRTFSDVGPSKLFSIVYRITSKIDSCPRFATNQWLDNRVLEQLKLAWEESKKQGESVCILIKAILLLILRDFSSFVKTQNPIWLKPGGLRRRISVEQALQSAINRLNIFYEKAYPNFPQNKKGRVILTDYDASESIPKCKVDVVMTSPPYCNRVDWDRMYAPEHFFLNAVGVWHTRTQFLGTTSVRQYPEFESDTKLVTERSKYLDEFLGKVRERQIQGETGSDYYVKYFTRYFAGLFRAFDNAASILSKDNLGIYFVVQENTHRGLQIKIGKALAESLSTKGFNVHPLKKSWQRHHLGLRNISKRFTLLKPKQRESIWHAVHQ